MYKIAVIGDRDSILGFMALGLEAVVVETAEQAKSTLKKMEDYGIIYITEQLAVQLRDEIARYSDRTYPAIIPIPGKTGSLNFGMDVLNKAVERAVGTNILT